MTVSWTDRIFPDDLIQVGDKFYLSYHGYLCKDTHEALEYGYAKNDRGEIWAIGILESTSLDGGWTDLFEGYYKPFGKMADTDRKIVGGQGLFFIKDKEKAVVSSFCYYSDGNEDETKNGITLLTQPVEGEYPKLGKEIDLDRYSRFA